MTAAQHPGQNPLTLLTNDAAGPKNAAHYPVTIKTDAHHRSALTPEPLPHDPG
jgi:hypothetical protein